MSDLQRRVFSQGGSRSNSKANSRSSSRTRTPLPNEGSDIEIDFSYSNLDELILAKVQSFQDTFENDDEPATTAEATKSKLTVNSITEIINSLKLSRTEVSTSSREMLLAQLFKLITSKPINVNEVSITDDQVYDLIKNFDNVKTDGELLLLIKSSSALIASDIEEFGTVILTDIIPILSKRLNDMGSNSAEIRSTIVVAMSTLLLILNDDSGAFGVDSYIESYVEMAEGLLISLDEKEIPVIVSLLHGIGVLLSLLPQGDFLNETIEDSMPKFVPFLEADNSDVAKAAGRLIGLCYESYLYDNDEEQDPDIIEQSPYYDSAELISIVEDLSTQSSKKISKKDKKETHSIFRDVLSTVTTYDDLQARLEIIKNPSTRPVLSHIKISRSRSLSITTWSIYLRLIHLRWCFGSGLQTQLVSNQPIKNILRDRSVYNEFANGNDDTKENKRAFTNKEKKLNDKEKTQEIERERAFKLQTLSDTLET